MTLLKPARRERADVVVIGAGPAGSSAALRLARHGLHVVHFERGAFDSGRKDRFGSGEGALPSMLSAFNRLRTGADSASWILTEATRLHLRWPDGSTTTDELPTGRSIGMLDREAFDNVLWQGACDAGTDGRRGWKVGHLLTDGAAVVGVMASNEQGETIAVEAPLVIDGGGRNAPSIRQFNLRRPEIGDDFVVVVLFFDKVPGLDPRVWEMHFFDRKAPAVVQGAQIMDGLVRFGLGTYLHGKRGSGLSPEEFFWLRLRSHPQLEERLRAARIVQPPYSRARLSYRISHIAQDGLLLVGDATGYLSPILGDGILMALRSAEVASEVAVEAFRSGDFSTKHLRGYERRWCAARRCRLWIGRALIAAYKQPSLVSQLRHLAPLRGLMLGALTRP